MGESMCSGEECMTKDGGHVWWREHLWQRKVGLTYDEVGGCAGGRRDGHWFYVFRHKI